MRKVVLFTLQDKKSEVQGPEKIFSISMVLGSMDRPHSLTWRKSAETKFQTNRKVDWATKCAVTCTGFMFYITLPYVFSRLFDKKKSCVHLPKISSSNTYFSNVCHRSISALVMLRTLAPEYFPKNLCWKVWKERKRCFNSLIWFFFYWKTWRKNPRMTRWEALIFLWTQSL